MFQFQDWWFPDGESHLPAYLQKYSEYQSPHRDTALSHVKKFGVALDIGGHIGLWSRALAARFDTVHAFEPVAAHADCFERNVRAPNVTLHRIALGREPGYVTAEDPADGNSGSTYVFETDSGMEMRTLDSYNFRTVDFIKIDVEGFEVFVCEGARDTLARCRPVIVMEQKNHATDYFGLPRYSARDFVASLGARVLGRINDDWVLGWDDPPDSPSGT